MHDARRRDEAERAARRDRRDGLARAAAEAAHVGGRDVRDGTVVARVCYFGLAHGLPVGGLGDGVDDEAGKFVCSSGER